MGRSGHGLYVSNQMREDARRRESYEREYGRTVFARDMAERQESGPFGPVRCVIVDDEAADGSHMATLAILEKDKLYRVVDYRDPAECRELYPQEKFWQENGGRVVLEEYPELAFFARRFVRVDQQDEMFRQIHQESTLWSE